MTKPSAKSTAWLITNHAPMEIVSKYQNIDSDVIAVDKGLEKIHDLGLNPDLIIGDLDSLDPQILAKYPSTPLLAHNPRKNETDTELALKYCLDSKKYSSIVICNDMQGRYDHSLAILQNLSWVHLNGIECRVETCDQILFFLSPQSTISAPIGSLLSLIPFGMDAVFESSSGLEYPLDSLKIHNHEGRGISNVFTSEIATLKLSQGQVLAIITYL